ncbi:hypothetical protein GOBAR_AA14857 [Gossypium barbadense]|uniref:Uncharacterized protein n=1 Tax=Gossypium barbadense TaxID=3634 RepID=A0A2P5XR13_GOSBA|nr:hypothetical protein GOBAR_AA14857 [Gossypium barbadense]
MALEGGFSGVMSGCWNDSASVFKCENSWLSKESAATNSAPRIQDLKRRITVAQACWVNDLSLLELRSQLNFLLSQQAVYWRQRAKVLWLCHGEANTKYFHAQESKCRRINQGSMLLAGSGNPCTRDDGCVCAVLLLAGVNYFRECLNETIVVLVTKKDKPTSKKDLRPTAPCNVLYKILVKVLACQLKKVTIYDFYSKMINYK